MKSIHVSEDILPIGEFKAHASYVVRRLREVKRPVVITQNGKPAAVLISPEEFDRLREHDRFIEAVREGFADSERGRVIEDKKLGRELDAEFSLSGRR